MKKQNQTLRPLGSLTIWAAASTLIVSPWLNFDPVNVPKLFLISIGVMTLFITKRGSFSSEILHQRTFYAVFLLICYSCTSIFYDSQSFPEALFGSYGRLFGILGFVVLLLIFLFSSSLSDYGDLVFVSKVVLYTSFLVQIYAISQELGFDFMPWNNVYPSPASTLGNSNFVSSFVAFSFFLSLIYIRKQKTKISKVLLLSLFSILTIFNLIISRSFQGFLFVAIGLSVFMMYRIRNFSKIKLSGVVLLYLMSILTVFLGILGSGPLKDSLYSYTFEYRMRYWETAIKMVRNDWIFGLGFDSYDDFYRVFKDTSSVFSNSPHNFALDLLVSGGVLLTFPTLFFLLYGSARILIQDFVLKREEKREMEHVILIVSHLILLLQSLINPFQVTLNVWLFLFSGMIWRFSLLEQSSRFASLGRQNVKGGLSFESLVIYTSVILCAASACYLLKSDLDLRTAISTRELNRIESLSKSRVPEYALIGIQVLSNNGYALKSLSGAERIVQENPNKVQAWRIIYELSLDKMTRHTAEARLKILDPTGSIKEPQG